jgi:hypothetical protein
MLETKETKKQTEQRERAEAKDFLLSVFSKQEKPTAYTILKSVSASGMSRTMKVVTYHEGQVLDITWWVGKLGMGTLTEKNGQRVLRVGGCGMDMGFHVVYSLSVVLYGYGADYRGGYTIDQRWL